MAEPEDDKKFSISVLYDGVRKAVEVNVKQALQALFQHALNAFGLQGNPGDLVLVFGGGQLDLSGKVGDIGLQPGSEVLLRPRVVRGG